MVDFILSVLKVILFICLLPFIFLTGYLIFLTATDYKPQNIENVTLENEKKAEFKKGEDFSILTFNMGYCGLDKDQDFFMENGTGSRAESKSKVEENLNSIAEILKEKAAAVVMLQEVDTDSKRSFNVNQYDYMKKNLAGYSSVFAQNYKVPWIILPINKPTGKVNSGLVTLNKFKVSKASRYQYPGKEAWAKQIMELDRCFVENRMPIKGGKELVLINSHLSAYDEGGTIRKQQLKFLQDYISAEYKKGNYIIVGGDWNHQIPGTDSKKFKASEETPEWFQKIPDDFKPISFNWVADPKISTTRSNSTPYKEGKNFRAVVDGFLVSDNIEVKSVKGFEFQFRYSDHNPVMGVFALK